MSDMLVRFPTKQHGNEWWWRTVEPYTHKGTWPSGTLNTHTLYLLWTHTHLSQHLCLQILQVIIPSCPLYLRWQTRSSCQILKAIKQKAVLPLTHSERWVDLVRRNRWKSYRVETSNTKQLAWKLFPNCTRGLRVIALGIQPRNVISCASVSS